MSDPDRLARAAARRSRITARVERPDGTIVGDAMEPNPTGAAGVALACELSRVAYRFAGHSGERVPRSEWPCVVKRPGAW